MILIASRRRACRTAVALLSVLAASVASGSRVDAQQCDLLMAPSKFDSPASGLPGYFQFQPRSGALAVGGSSGSARLAVRYNYGFLVYNLASPGAPSRLSVEDLLGEGYPKNGDGQNRVGPLDLSADGLRALQPWTDTAGYGTIAMSSTGSGFSSGGDFLPVGRSALGVAVVKTGTRYLGFSFTGTGIYAADITSYTSNIGPASKNAIRSELISNVSVGSPVGITGLESAGRAYIVAWSDATVAVIDVSNPGSASGGLTANFTAQTYTATQLGIPAGNFLLGLAAAFHPSDGAIHILAEGGTFSGTNIASAAVTLSRIDPSSGSLIVKSYQPPSGAKNAQSQVVLLPSSTDVVAYFLEGTDAGLLKPHVHSSSDFSTNLADLVPAFAGGPTQAVSLVGLRGSGDNVYLYMMDSAGGLGHLSGLRDGTEPGDGNPERGERSLLGRHGNGRRGRRRRLHR